MSELVKRSFTGFALGLIAIVSLLFAPAWVFVLFASMCLVFVLITEWPRLFAYHQKRFWLLMPLYPIFPFVLIMLMHLQGYEIVTILLIALTAAHDAGSYLVGKKVGKHKISPEMSPSKTWEGFIGGFMLSFLLSLLFFKDNNLEVIFGFVLPFVFLVSSCALAGDLFESYLKRRAGIKDSGSILPGHGGVLDRIDSLLFAAVLVYLLRSPLSKLIS